MKTERNITYISRGCQQSLAGLKLKYAKLFTVPVPGSGRSKRIFWHHLVHDSGLSQCFWKSVTCLTIKDIWWDLEDSEDPEFCTIKYWIGTQRNIKANWTCSRWSGIFTNFLVSMILVLRHDNLTNFSHCFVFRSIFLLHIFLLWRASCSLDTEKLQKVSVYIRPSAAGRIFQPCQLRPCCLDFIIAE